MLCHKIGNIIVTGTDSILISAFLGLSLLGKYSNYVMITLALTSLIAVFITGMQASIGDSVAQRCPAENYELFKRIHFIIAWLNGLFTICCICLFQHFMTVWSSVVGKEQSLDFLCMFLLSVSFYITISRKVVNAFKEAVGLFIQDAYKPIVEAVLNIVLSIVLCRYIGLAGIILGTILSSVTFVIWIEAYVLYKNYFKLNFMRYFARYGINLLVFGAVGTGVYFLCSLMPAAGIGWFIVKALVCLVAVNLLFALIFSRTEEFRYCLALGKNLVGRVFFRKRVTEPAPEPSDRETVGADDNGDAAESSPEREAAATDDAAGAGTDEERAG